MVVGFSHGNGEREGKRERKPKKVLSVDTADHFERRCLISFEIACAWPTAMLWSLSILCLGYCQGRAPFLCLGFSVSDYLSFWLEVGMGEGAQSQRESGKG